MMSGILKRKLEEGPSPYLSLQGSEDEEVSCSDSGNSSDSLNHQVPSGPLDCKTRTPHASSLQQQTKRLRSRNVHFESVTVYYFNRRQGFTSVPTQGGSTLGMSPRHSGVKHFTLREFAMEQKRSHRNMLRDHLKEEKLNAIKLRLTKNGTVSSVEADTLTLDDISEDDLDVDNTEVDDYFFLQPLTTRRRRALLRASGVRRIDVDEKHELRSLRMSREECGCHCRGICDPETCACSLAGIKCQVDRMSFPCGCTQDGCSNTTGRLEFNPVRVRTHFLHTVMKLELERSREEQQQQPEPQLVTNGNSYHGDPSLVQQQQQQQPPPPNLQFPLMSNSAHIPIMHLQNTSDTEIHLDEEEEEEEEDEDEDDEEDEEDDEDDEAYEEDEDGSSVCSGLSDCSTHSLETIEDGDEDEEEDWDFTINKTNPAYPLPLPSVMGFSFSNTPSSMQHYPTDQTAAFSGDSVATAHSDMTGEPHCQTQLQTDPCQSLRPQTCSHVDTGESNSAPAVECDQQQHPVKPEHSPDHQDRQTQASLEQPELLNEEA